MLSTNLKISETLPVSESKWMSELRSCAADHLVGLPPELALDGQIHRFDAGKPGSGWYVGNIVQGSRGQLPLVSFGDWYSGVKHTYSPMHLRRADRREVKNLTENHLKSATEEKRYRQEACASRARDLFEKLPLAAASHPYLQRKMVQSHGARECNGELVIFCQDAGGKIWGGQRVSANGQKRFLKGQRVKGLYHLIGSLDGAQEAFLCEGFATGASIHEATGKAVICAFHCSNLPTVARAITQRYPSLRIIVCGDDDVSNSRNVGREEAEKAAEICMSKAIFPVFNDVSSRPTDFNDLHVLQGLEVVRTQINDSAGDSCAYKALGIRGTTHYFYLQKTKTVVEISQFTPEKIFLLIPMKHLLARYPDTDGSGKIRWNDVKADLVAASMDAGVYDAHKIRGVGVWLDAGRKVVNTGKELFVDGQEMALHTISSRYVYTLGDAACSFDGLEEPLERKETQAFAEGLKLFNWEDPQSAIYAAGWLATARIGGALPIRPHIWVTGPKGSGKSTFVENVGMPALGSCQYQFQGGSTAAGIRQTIGANSVPVIFDEFETHKDTRENQRVLDYFRQCWSSTNARIVKGTPEGFAVSYVPSSPVILSGIRVHFENDADRSRFTLLELKKHASSQEQKAKMELFFSKLDRKFGDRLFARSLMLIDTIAASAKIFERVIAIKTIQRVGQQLGGLLAGYWSLYSEQVVTEEKAEEIVAKLHLDGIKDEIDEADEEDCLQHLMTSIVRLNVVTDGRFSTEETTVGNVATGGTAEQKKELEKYGIKVKEETIAVACSHAELKKIFADSHWPSWSRSLKRIDGATKKAERICGWVTKCVVVPLPRQGEDAGPPSGGESVTREQWQTVQDLIVNDDGEQVVVPSGTPCKVVANVWREDADQITKAGIARQVKRHDNLVCVHLAGKLRAIDRRMLVQGTG